MTIYGLDAFCRVVAAEFDRPSDDIVPAARIVGDLHFDSLDILELAVFLEELIGKDIPDPLFSDNDTTTIEDVYRFYAVAASV
jgi:acyl carrier protein